ncbi:hypothetical protein [Nostoc sp. 'Peltigera membranacea cyanobiont' 210A]|nr:hypothetical protein [Nostoc sp. 'Peltigera membranacea cyanobiont' 210A]
MLRERFAQGMFYSGNVLLRERLLRKLITATAMPAAGVAIALSGFRGDRI